MTFKQIETVVLPPPPSSASPNTVVVLSQRASIPIADSSFTHPVEMTNRVRHSKQRLASKQLVQPAQTSSTDDNLPVGTWINPTPTPPPSTVNHHETTSTD